MKKTKDSNSIRYFEHDKGSRNDMKIIMLESMIGKHIGYALYFKLLEIMADNEDGKLDPSLNDAYAISLSLSSDEYRKLMECCLSIGLYETDEDGFVYSPRFTDWINDIRSKVGKLRSASIAGNEAKKKYRSLQPVENQSEHEGVKEDVPIGSQSEHEGVKEDVPIGSQSENEDAKEDVPIGSQSEHEDAKEDVPIGSQSEHEDAKEDVPIGSQSEHEDAKEDVPIGSQSEKQAIVPAVDADAEPKSRQKLTAERIKQEKADMEASPDNPLKRIIECWNANATSSRCSGPSDILRSSAKKALNSYKEDEVIGAIKHYWAVIKNPQQNYTFIFDLSTFLKQSNALPRFVDKSCLDNWKYSEKTQPGTPQPRKEASGRWE